MKRPGRTTFAGLFIGLGFLALVLLLETIMDTVFIAWKIFTSGILLAAAALVAFNLGCKSESALCKLTDVTHKLRKMID